jgi:hypothetical protein
MIVWIQGLLRQPARFLAMIVAEPTHDASGRWLPGFGDNVWWRCRFDVCPTCGRMEFAKGAEVTCTRCGLLYTSDHPHGWIPKACPSCGQVGRFETPS